MTEVICPFCGTPNPPEAEYCQSCKKPLYELPESGQPDWMKNLRNFTSNDPAWQNHPAEEEPGSKPESDPEDEIPEWLARIRRRTQEERQELEDGFKEIDEGNEPETTPPPSEEELSQWLPAGEETGGKPLGAPEIPLEEWFGEAREEKSTSDEEPAKLEQTPASDLPFFDKEDSETVVPPAGEEALQPGDKTVLRSEESESPEEIRDWLEQLLPDEPKDEIDFSDFAIPPAFQVENEPAVEDDAATSEPDFEAAPEFLENAGEAAFKTEFPDLPEEAAQKTGGEDGSQLPAVESPGLDPDVETGLREDLGLAAIEGDEIAQPARLDETVPADQPGAHLPAGAEPEIEPAQLPGWLEAIRPVESVAPLRFTAEADNRVETSGPLAGFQGVIPGGAAASAYTPPAAYTVKLHVTDKQRIYANLLENLVNEEAKPADKSVEKTAAPQSALKLFIAIILIGFLAFIMVSGFEVGGLPTLYAPETVAFFDGVQRLQPTDATTSRLLVAVDYEPGLAGEMQTISLYPLQELLETGTSLALISTLPGGPALGEKLVSDSTGLMPAFQYDQQVINLGYLVGGSASLASLAVAPSTAVQYGFGGQSVWNSPLLQGIQSLADFDGLLLLTDNPETARAWIEQVQPFLRGKPLLVISSAQSGPMILPYYQSGQVQGLLAGLSGSTAYDQLAQRPTGNSRFYWNAYQSGLLLITLAILIGGIVFAIQDAIRRWQPVKRI